MNLDPKFDPKNQLPPKVRSIQDRLMPGGVRKAQRAEKIQEGMADNIVLLKGLLRQTLADLTTLSSLVIASAEKPSPEDYQAAYEWSKAFQEEISSLKVEATGNAFETPDTPQGA